MAHFLSTSSGSLHRQGDGMSSSSPNDGDKAVPGIDPASKTLHVAPMMDVTTREFRYFLRLLTRRTTLWTEMVVDETVVHARDRHHLLGHDTAERPLVCQLGGCSPAAARTAARILVEEWGYEAVDLNCACPSRKVCGKHAFGAALMLNQQVAVDMIQQIQEAVRESGRSVPVSIKTRIGVDDQDDLPFLVEYIRRLRPHCKRFVIHARKVHTKGLSTTQNRNVPPLNYPRVYAICRHFPDCEFIINGGIQTLREARTLCFGSDRVADEAEAHGDTPCVICNHPNGSCTAPPPRGAVPPNLRGAMLGRAARDNPCLFADADRGFFGAAAGNPCRTRREVLERYCAYLERAYPARCAEADDGDPKVTARMAPAAPAATHDEERRYCHLCRGVYEGDRSYRGPKCWNNSKTDENQNDNEATLDPALDEGGGADRPPAKFAGHVMDRSFKPVLGVFYGLRGCGRFRRRLEALSRDPWVRNCGPGAVLRMALNGVDAALLDRPFRHFDDDEDDAAEENLHLSKPITDAGASS